jgi:hypothetical protein
MLLESTNERRVRNFSNITSLQSFQSIRSTIPQTWKDGSVYSNQLSLPKDIRRTEKEIRKTLNLSKLKRVSLMKSAHKIILKEKFDNNFFVTENSKVEVKKSLNESQQVLLLTIPLHTEDQYSSVLPTSEKKSFSKIKLVKSYEIRHPRSKSCLKNFISNSRKESTYEFVHASQSLSRESYGLKLKKEQLERLQEDKEHEIGELIENIQTSKESEKLMKKCFEIKFNSYMVSLIKQKEFEKEKLEDLKEEQLKLDFEMKKLNYTLSRQKVLFERLMEFRIFLICVKARLKNLPSHFLAKLYEDTPHDPFSKMLKIINIKKTKTNIKSLTTNYNSNYNNALIDKKNKKLTNFLPKRKNAAKFFHQDTLIKENKKFREDIDKFSVYLNDQVYSSKEEFLNDLAGIEEDNLYLLNIYNQNKIKLNEMYRSYSKSIEEDKKFLVYHTDRIAVEEAKLQTLKEKNRKYLEEKHQLLKEEEIHINENLTNLSLHLQSPNQTHPRNNIFLRLNDFHKNIFTNLPKEININLRTTFKLMDPSTIFINKVKDIEKILNTLLDTYNNYKTSKEKKKLLEIESKFEKERKSNKSTEQRLRDEKRRDQLQDIITKKEKQIVILPKRRFFEKFRPIEKQKTKSKSNEKYENKVFDDYISI